MSHNFAADHLHATAQGDLHSAAERSIAHSVSLFTHEGGIKNIAQAGSNTLQAHTGPLDILADQSLVITSTHDEIHVFAKEKIVLQSGQSSITLDGANIVFACPDTLSVKGNGTAFLGGAFGEAALEGLPDTRPKLFDEQFRAISTATGKPLEGQTYRMQLESGETQEGTTNKDGKTSRALSAEAEPLTIEWIGDTEAFYFPDEARIGGC